jgi:RND family efflux transporter MFP subunit
MTEPSELRSNLSALRIEREPEVRTQPGGRRFRWGLQAIALVVILGGLLYALRGRWLAAPEVEVLTVTATHPVQADAVLTATGYLEAHTQAVLSAKIPGRIETLPVTEGDRVQKGQLIATLEHRDAEAQLQQARAQLARARADLAELMANLEWDRRELQRQQDLVEGGIATRSALDTAQTKLGADEARRDVLAAAVQQAEAAVRGAQVFLDYHFIRAPFTGTITAKPAEVGETVAAGAVPGQTVGSIVTLADLTDLEVEVEVSEASIGKIELGQSASISVDAIPDRQFPGRVRQILPAADRSKAIVQVKVHFEEIDPRLKTDLSAKATFTRGPLDAAALAEPPKLLVPRSALVGGSAVYRVDASGMVHLTPVVLGPGQDRQDPVEVREGLSDGDTIVAAPAGAKLSDGSRIRPRGRTNG